MGRRTFARARLWLAAAAALVVAIAVVALRSGADEARAPAPAPRAPAAPPAPEPLATAPPVPAPAALPSAPASDPSPAEERQMSELRAEVDTHPQAAVALAEDGERRFPSGPYAEERAWLRMRALVHLGEIGIARDAARRFYELYPGSPLARYVFRLTGMRPMPPLGPPR